MTGFLHVTRLPPSPSGVALYARDMADVYAKIGPTSVQRMPAAPGASQSVSVLLGTWRAVRRRVGRRSATVVTFELAGRGIAETWTAWALVRAQRRVWITVHDSPDVCGPSLLFAPLDRPGGRRLGLALSRLIGRRMERDLLVRAERVFTLSAAGAEALDRKYSLENVTRAIPHVVAELPKHSKEHRILVPGYVGDPDSVLPLLRLMPTLPAEWRLVIGAAPPETARAIAAEASQLGVDRAVEFLGFVTESVLEDEFGRASIVVRWRRDGWSQGPARYAVSGPLIRSLARGCVVVTNDRRGALECLRAAGARVVGDGQRGAEELCVAVTEYVRDEDLRSSTGEAALKHAAVHHSPDSVVSRLEEQMA